MVVRDGYQPNGPAVDLAKVRPPQEPTAARRPCDEPIRSQAHANAALDDAEYLAYVELEVCKLKTALLMKRWPRLR